MGERLEKVIFEDVYKRIKKERKITERDEKKLLRIFRDQFRNAYTTIKEEKVRKYIFTPSGRIVWTVMGKAREYQILPQANFCSCDDFYYRVLNYEKFLCYHVIAQKIAEALGKHITIKEEDSAYEVLLCGLRKPITDDRKLPMKEVENIRKTVRRILLDKAGLSAKQLLLQIHVFGFEVQTPRHLAAILASDKKERFKCKEGKWFLK